MPLDNYHLIEIQSEISKFGEEYLAFDQGVQLVLNTTSQNQLNGNLHPILS